jgi:tetratricopeptide (TPR) repeat protein
MIPLFRLVFLPLCAATAWAQQPEPPPLNRAPTDKVGNLPPHTMLLSQRAAEAFAKRDWNSARTAYQEMLKSDPANALAWANLGAVEQQAGRPREAMEAFSKSVQHNPNLAQSWSALGLLHAEKGDTYLAVSMFTRAIHEDPADARAHNYLAIAAKTLGWRDAAEMELMRALELNPDYGIANFNLALLYLDQKPPALELAKRHYDKALAHGVAKDDIVERRLKE